MTMDAVRIDTLPTTKLLLSTKVPDTTDSSKEKDDDILFIDEIDEDDEIRLRVSDDEEVEQDNTSGHTESQQTSLEIKRNDLEFDVHIAVTSKDSSKLHHKGLIIKEDLPEKDTNRLVEEEDSSGNSSLEEKIVNEIDSINDEESTMSGSERVPPLMQNSPKYWSNNFDKRWSQRGRQNFSHRNSNDWYNKQFPDKDKFSNRSNFNNHNNHFSRVRNSTGGSHNSQYRENCNRESKKEEINESPKVKNRISGSGDTNANHSIQENGISDDLQSKENDSSVRNDKSITENVKNNGKDTKNSEVKSEQKENEQGSDESKVSADQKCLKTSSDSNSDILKNNEVKCTTEELADTKSNSDGALSPTKDCDVSMTEIEKEKSESKSEKNSKHEENKCSSNVNDKVSNDTETRSSDAELEIEEKSAKSEVPDEASHDNDISGTDKCENLMEVDDNNENSCSVSDKNSGSDDKTSASGNAKDFDVDVSKNNDKNLSENLETQNNVTDDKVKQQIDSTNEHSDTKSNNNIDTNENSNHSLEDDKSTIISEIEISEMEINDGKNLLTADDKTNEVMDVETDAESSNSLLIAVADIKGSDSNDSKPSMDKDNKNSSDGSSLIKDENNSNREDEEKIKETEKQLEDVKHSVKGENSNPSEANDEQEKINIEEVDLADDESEAGASANPTEVENHTSTTNVDAMNNTSMDNNDTSLTVPISTVNNVVSTVDNDKVEESNENGRAVVHKKRRRKRFSDIIYQEIAASEIPAENNGVRQKRRSARNAEEMIRKEILKNDEEDEDSSDSSRLVPVHYKKTNTGPSSGSSGLLAQPLSPPSLKRTLDDVDCPVESTATLKRIKSSLDGSGGASSPVTTATAASTAKTMSPQQQQPTQEKDKEKEREKKEFAPKSKESMAETKELVRKISQEDIRGKLKKLTPEELEALLLQKIVECITIRGEMGKLREQARTSKRNQEATRAKCQQLQKQVEGFDMVLKRITYDKNSNSDKFVPPIKINRSVGLQVNFLSDHGIQNLKQIQVLKAAAVANNGSTTPNGAMTAGGKAAALASVHPQQSIGGLQSPRKMLKTRSPRRPDVPGANGVVVHTSGSSPGGGGLVTTTVGGAATPTALVMNKSMPLDPKRSISLQNSSNIVQLVPPGQQQQQHQQQQTVVVNSNLGGNGAGGTNNRSATLTIQRNANAAAAAASSNKTSDLIDLTDEEDKTKSPVIAPITSAISARLPRVLQAVPASVALTNSTNLRLVQAGTHGSPTTLVNNTSTRLAYLMQSGVSGVPTRQLVLTSSNTIRPVTSVSTRNISTISYKQGVPTLTNGTVRVLTTQAPTAVQVSRHPAPLPETPSPDSNPMWKLPPPAPSLKISKVATGIVLSWNMTLSDKFAEIVSYQLYAYQEVAGTNPSASLWKKVGDVRALPLPMACTLTQFTEGNNYYFAVRAVDIHSRFGQYSKPGNISL